MQAAPFLKDLVLIGGGHAHVHVVKSFGMKPMPGERLTLFGRDIETPYSGMIPGFVAGQYSFDECHIDLARLAAWTGARLIQAEAIGLDRANRQVLLRDRPPVSYDLLSIDVGSSPGVEAIPGAFVVVRQNGDEECMCKQLVKDAGMYFLKPLNPAYPLMRMAEDAVICGVVREATMRFF